MTESNEVLSMIAQFDLTPAEAVDYHAVETQGYTQTQWASERDLDSHQSVGRNVREARQKLPDPQDVIDTVVVDPNEIIESLRFNTRPPGMKNQRRAVIRVRPSFESTSEASIFYKESRNSYPPEMDPKPIHINPRAFVGENVVDRPLRQHQRTLAEEDLDDPTDGDIEEYTQTAFEVWENSIRNNLNPSADISNGKPHEESHVVSVKYDDDSAE